MAIHHALPGELIDIKPLGEALMATRTATLYKTQYLEVFRIILLAGKQMPEHQVVGEVTVQCLRRQRRIFHRHHAGRHAGRQPEVPGGRSAAFAGRYRGLVCAHHPAAPWRLRS